MRVHGVVEKSASFLCPSLYLPYEVPHWLYISKFTRLRAVSRRQHGSCYPCFVTATADCTFREHYWCSDIDLGSDRCDSPTHPTPSPPVRIITMIAVVHDCVVQCGHKCVLCITFSLLAKKVIVIIIFISYSKKTMSIITNNCTVGGLPEKLIAHWLAAQIKWKWMFHRILYSIRVRKTNNKDNRPRQQIYVQVQ